MDYPVPAGSRHRARFRASSPEPPAKELTTMHPLVAEVANERRKTLLAEAEQARRITQARRSGTLSP
jgi:hypothetical protein